MLRKNVAYTATVLRNGNPRKYVDCPSFNRPRPPVEFTQYLKGVFPRSTSILPGQEAIYSYQHVNEDTDVRSQTLPVGPHGVLSDKFAFTSHKTQKYSKQRNAELLKVATIGNTGL